jgi:hypothetical protein
MLGAPFQGEYGLPGAKEDNMEAPVCVPVPPVRVPRDISQPDMLGLPVLQKTTGSRLCEPVGLLGWAVECVGGCLVIATGLRS